MSLSQDHADLPRLLELAREEARRFLDELPEAPVAHDVPEIEPHGLPESGLGAAGALDILGARYGPWLSASPGPRYFARPHLAGHGAGSGGLSAPHVAAAASS